MPSSSPAAVSIHLGLAIELAPGQLFTLERHYLPLGKIGGFPSWLNPAAIPKSEEMACSNCASPMAFLLQIYCTNPADPPHAFHRVLYLFACRKGTCAKTNDASNFVLFRCQLPRQSPFYSPVEALDPSLVGNIADPFFDAKTYANLCVVCGCRAGKRCAKCATRMYCSKDHQIIDWRTVHKDECSDQQGEVGNSVLDSTERMGMRQKHGFTFREYGLEMTSGGERAAAEDDAGNTSEEDSDDEETTDGDEREKGEGADKLREEKKKMKKYEEEAEANGVQSKDFEGLEESRKDMEYGRFSKALEDEPEQILRYQRGGQPQLATDFSPRPTKIPECPLCGGQRNFEFQLMPHLLTLIDVDAVEESLDWATLLVYTCQANCPIPDDGYAREWLFKQDFVAQPREEDGK